MHLLCSPHSPTALSHHVSHQREQLKRPSLSTGVQAFPISINRRSSDARTFIVDSFRAFDYAVKSSSTVVEAVSSNIDEKDQNLVFVAGATGKVGARLVRELLKLGFSVRAGVRSAQRADSLLQSVRGMNIDPAPTGLVQPIERLEIVECDLEKKDQIVPALGKASIVMCCIGASEKEIFDVTGPYRIDYLATKHLIDAATVSKVNHFILLTSLGTNKFGLPAAILNLFWGVLCWKRKAEEALLASGIPYTIVRPGGMERPTDAYKETHNVTLSQGDSLFGGQVSNLQVAELMACIAKNRGLSYGKVVEVIAETTAPLTPMEELLAKIPAESIFKESGDASVPNVVPSTTPSADIEKEPTQTKATVASPLSPYIMYEGLKPPTSPTPTPSTGSAAVNASGAGMIQSESNSSPSSLVVNSSEVSTTISETVISKAEEGTKSPLSPYTRYEDLKPPTSPTPTPSTGSAATIGTDAGTTKAATNSSPSPLVANSTEPSTTISEAVISKPGERTRSPLSPYTSYEDLKPPSSPCPTPSGPRQEIHSSSASNCVSPELTGGNDAAENIKGEAPVADNSVDAEQHPKLRATPLSPFTMYEDLKPPSSPTPSLKT